MNEATARIEQFLRTDPRDVGCEQAMELLHIYVDLVVAGDGAVVAGDGAVVAGDGAVVAGDGAQARYPGITAHLRACGPCAQDFEGLLAAVGG